MGAYFAAMTCYSNALTRCLLYRTFSIKPKKGMIRSKYETFVVKALPTSTRAYKESLSLGMNQDPKYTQVREKKSRNITWY